MLAPLVLTLQLDDRAQARFEAERRRWFPAGRTKVGAHLTLFHAVPGEREEQVLADLRESAGPSFPVRVAGLRSLGRGVAYELDSPELVRRHSWLQQRWWSELTRQDQQSFRPHITVQNKVDPGRARTTLDSLRAGFEPFDMDALGWVAWRYRGGPWEELARIPFVGAEPGGDGA